MNTQEKALLRPTSYFNRKISRRESLRLMLGASISLSIFLEACAKGQDEAVLPLCEGSMGSLLPEGEIDCTKLPSIQLNPVTESLLRNTVHPIAQLLPEKSRNLGIYVHKVDNLPVALTGGIQMKGGSLSTHLFVKSGEEIPPDEDLNVANYHEFLHGFDRLGKKTTQRHTTQNRVMDTFEDNGLFPIFTEGTYLASGVGGHPQTSIYELYASGLTVMRFFPDQFIQNLKAVENPRAKKIASLVALDFINSLQARAYKEVTIAELPYPKALLDELRILAA